MYKVGEYIVYKKDVCKILDIKENKINKTMYYILSPIDDETLKVDVPVDNRCNFIRDLITKEQVEEIINKIPDIKEIETSDRIIENEYKELMKKGTHEDLIKIIKTTYLRNKTRKDSKKKISEKDEYYLERAEKYLYTEFGMVLTLNYEQTKQYIIDKIKNK